MKTQKDICQNRKPQKAVYFKKLQVRKSFKTDTHKTLYKRKQHLQMRSHVSQQQKNKTGLRSLKRFEVLVLTTLLGFYFNLRVVLNYMYMEAVKHGQTGCALLSSDPCHRRVSHKCCQIVLSDFLPYNPKCLLQSSEKYSLAKQNCPQT